MLPSVVRAAAVEPAKSLVVVDVNYNPQPQEEWPRRKQQLLEDTFLTLIVSEASKL